MAGLPEFTDKIYADLLRASIRSGLSGRSSISPESEHTTNASDSAEDDLLDYLRKLRRWLRASDIARVLNCNIDTVYLRIKNDGLPARRDGARWKFDPAEVAHWMQTRTEIQDLAISSMRAKNAERIGRGKRREK